jgi:hypothetical protein
VLYSIDVTDDVVHIHDNIDDVVYDVLGDAVHTRACIARLQCLQFDYAPVDKIVHASTHVRNAWRCV